MTPEFVVGFAKDALILTILVSMPILAMGLVVGLAISIVQAATSVQEMTLSFVPKILAVLFALVFFTPWMLEKLMSFTVKLITNIPVYIR